MHRRDFRRVAGLLVGQIHGVERLSLCQSLGTSPPPLPLGGLSKLRDKAHGIVTGSDASNRIGSGKLMG
jgi:hypothetical protein